MTSDSGMSATGARISRTARITSGVRRSYTRGVDAAVRASRTPAATVTMGASEVEEEILKEIASALVLMTIATAACAQGRDAQGRASQARASQGCPALETRAPNAPRQQPDFPGQTRACAAPASAAFDVVVVAK